MTHQWLTEAGVRLNLLPAVARRAGAFRRRLLAVVVEVADYLLAERVGGQAGDRAGVGRGHEVDDADGLGPSGVVGQSSASRLGDDINSASFQ